MLRPSRRIEVPKHRHLKCLDDQYQPTLRENFVIFPDRTQPSTTILCDDCNVPKGSPRMADWPIAKLTSVFLSRPGYLTKASRFQKPQILRLKIPDIANHMELWTALVETMDRSRAPAEKMSVFPVVACRHQHVSCVARADHVDNWIKDNSVSWLAARPPSTVCSTMRTVMHFWAWDSSPHRTPWRLRQRNDDNLFDSVWRDGDGRWLLWPSCAMSPPTLPLWCRSFSWRKLEWRQQSALPLTSQASSTLEIQACVKHYRWDVNADTSWWRGVPPLGHLSRHDVMTNTQRSAHEQRTQTLRATHQERVAQHKKRRGSTIAKEVENVVDEDDPLEKIASVSDAFTTLGNQGGAMPWTARKIKNHWQK